MRRLFGNRRGQSVLEYGILIAVVVGALIAMQTYVRRAINWRIKTEVDAFTEGEEQHYEPTMTSRLTTATRLTDESAVGYDATGTTADILTETEQESHTVTTWP